MTVSPIMSPIQRTWTAEQVESESTRDAPLVIIEGRVYDCTEFIHSHPGSDIIADYHGQDVTAVMKDFSVHQHSDAAYTLLDDLCVGVLAAEAADDVIMADGRVIDGGHYGDEQQQLNYKQNNGNNKYKRKQYIDFTKPIFAQVWRLNLPRDEYIEMIHTPHHLPFVARFFSNPFLEMCSRTPWYVVPVLWLPYISWLGYQAMQTMSMEVYLTQFVIGLFVWSVAEYGLHRHLFHVDDKLPDHRLFILLHFTFHGVHHFLPMDKMRLVFPPALAAPFLALSWTILRSVLSYSGTCAALSGILFGYVCYDCFHFYVHHGRPLTSYMKSMKSYHAQHHYANHRASFGITSKFWDGVFGT